MNISNNLSTRELKTNLEPKINSAQVTELLDKQSHLLEDFTFETFSELVNQCKKNTLDQQAIIRLAWDIVEMSKNVPCCCEQGEVHDMSDRVCKVIKELAEVADHKRIESKSFSRAARFIADSSSNFLVAC